MNTIDNTSKIYEVYKLRFQEKSNAELIDLLNEDKRKTGWVRRRGIYLSVLNSELHSRGLDKS